ncbi:HipA domain-containing protein, partial [Ruminiclostridium cellobioparum]|uniref:HipA domain-containing protein n=1 Tax=Ruminiclostridium cellobioparum TaxID=29355 RepID=UPI0028A73B73
MIDFTPCVVNKFKAYGGANGNKINVRYDDKSYMLKFPPRPSRNREMSYTNGCISEYLACHIFEALGFRTQETLLGTYTDSRGKEKTVVACGDFTEDGKKLIEFAHLKNTCIDSEQSGYGKELTSILQAIEEQTLLPPDQLRDFFWDMFIADALLGNFDRHNGNWGILVDERLQTAEIAPVYDCGSCLYPQLAAENMQA